jgi:hypothetical protein
VSEKSTRPDSPQGRSLSSLEGDEGLAALRQAVVYRGDVTLGLSSGEQLVGYAAALEEVAGGTRLQWWPGDGGGATRVDVATIEALDFSGPDKAFGRSWDAWVKRHDEARRLLERGLDPGEYEPRPEDLD